MKILNKIIENDTAIFLVEEEGEQLKKFFPRAYQKIKQDVELKGFRKGKVPLDLFLKKLGPTYLYSYSAEILTEEIYKDIVKDNEDLNFISTPDIDIKEFDPQKKIVIEFKMLLKPKVILPDINDLILEKEEYIKVTDKDIDDEIDKYLNQHSYMKVIDSPAKKGDIVVIDYKGYINGVEFKGGKDSNYPLELGSQTFIQGFEESLIGVKEGENKKITVTFPKDYISKDLQGKEAVFDINIRAVKEKITPNLDEEFIKQLNIDKVKSKEEFIQFLENSLKESKENNNLENKKKNILKQLLDKSLVSIPDKIINQQYESHIENFEKSFKKHKLNINDYYTMYNTTEDKFKEDLKKDIINNLKTQFILDELITNMNIQLTENEEKEFYNKQSKLSKNNKEDLLYNLKVNKALESLMEKLINNNE